MWIQVIRAPPYMSLPPSVRESYGHPNIAATSDQRVRDHGRLRLSGQRNRACAVVLEANRTEAPIQPCPIQPFVIDMLSVTMNSCGDGAALAGPGSCRPHIPKVVTFRVVRRGREFWIEAVEDDGSRRFLERCDSLEEANQRLEEFRIIAERIERRASSDEPHSM